MHFRRNNDLVPRNFKKNVMVALHSVGRLVEGEGGSVTFERRQVHLYEQRARTYRIALKDPELSSFEGIENAVKTHKAHHNMMDLDTSFIEQGPGSALPWTSAPTPVATAKARAHIGYPRATVGDLL